jgi:hypothetical protein
VRRPHPALADLFAEGRLWLSWRAAPSGPDHSNPRIVTASYVTVNGKPSPTPAGGHVCEGDAVSTRPLLRRVALVIEFAVHGRNLWPVGRASGLAGQRHGAAARLRVNL